MIRKIFQRPEPRQAYLHDGAFVALVFSCSLACAADAAPMARYRIEQPSQPLAEALRAIARQTGVSVLFDPGKVGGRTSHAVSGLMTAAEAIARALEGTDLVLTVMVDGSIVVRSPGTPSPSRAPPSSSGEVAPAVTLGPLGDAARAPAAVLAQASSPTVTGSGAGGADGSTQVDGNTRLKSTEAASPRGGASSAVCTRPQ